ncbi:Fic family protein [Mycobacterium hackensackense]|uniref:Fic family protein n=1 Tax=Mycobacterium hackensackense TaxID=228909 RepID=UPI0022659E94|nr:Fic family protein [Mycobacterium hackensackense]MCV7255505.1 Fic family protein [Mycobacterium hackensackense]
MSDNSETIAYMTQGPEELGVYRPFPSFTEWDTGGFDDALFERYAKLLAASKQAASPENLEEAMTAAMRYAAIDTGAIEGLYTVDRGFTRTIATQAAAWEQVIDARGAHVRLAFDDALSGYEYVLDAATKTVDISELWIRELHQIICKSQKTYTVYGEFGSQERPLPKGTYKTMPNSPTLADGRVHAYAPVIDTPPEMRRLVEELRSEAFALAHPVIQAAYAHYGFVCIHPFSDGNGRVARALSSVYLYRSPGVPLIVFADQRNDYLDALEAADGGNQFQFAQFVMTRTIDAIGIIRASLQRSGPPIASTLAGLNELFGGETGDEELLAGAMRLRQLAVAEVKKQLAALTLPSRLKVEAYMGNAGSPPVPEGYRTIGADGLWFISARSDWPRELSLTLRVGIFVRIDDSMPSELIMTSHPGDGLEVWLRELSETANETLNLKLSGWSEGVIAQFLADVAASAIAES